METKTEKELGEIGPTAFRSDSPETPRTDRDEDGLRAPRRFVRHRWPRPAISRTEDIGGAGAEGSMRHAGRPLKTELAEVLSTQPGIDTASPAEPEPRALGRLLDLSMYLAGPVAGAATAYALSVTGGEAVHNAAVVLLALLGGRAMIRGDFGRARVLPLMGRVLRLLVPLCWAAIMLALHVLEALPGIDAAGAALVVLVAAAVAAAADGGVTRRTRSRRATRVAVIGASGPADSLARELAIAGLDDDYQVVGRISFYRDPSPLAGEVPVIGHLGELAEIMVRHDIGLLLMTGQVPRMPVFEEIVRSCLHLPVRLRELSSFYEDVFCHVATTEINAAWFQYVIHPKYRAGATLAERTLDIVLATLVGVVTLPVLVVIAIIIRRDGGPVIFRQMRIGAGGRPFTIYKLRTMRSENSDSSWAAESDPRVTSIGRFLRRTHLDELPQLINVVRGEMSLVGPRPEQPQIVAELERTIPYYQRRHLIKPGLTGWAQVRCGYAGSTSGSAWKLCHDLHYLKHRSFLLNLLILGETVRVLLVDSQYTAHPASVDFILAPQQSTVEGVPAAVA